MFQEQSNELILFKTSQERESSEEYFNKSSDHFSNVILPFYHNYELKSFIGIHGVNLAYKAFLQSNSSRYLIIVTGYNESLLKYAYTIYEFFQKGFSVFIYDHRGQGLSQRFIADVTIGYVDRFDYMVDDFEIFVNTIVKNYLPKSSYKIYALGHSMGGAVLSAAIEKVKLNGYILSSPMLKVRVPLSFEWAVFCLALFLDKIGFSHSAISHNTDFSRPKSFETNDVTHSRFHYETWHREAKKNSLTFLFSVSIHWLKEAISFSRRVRKGKFVIGCRKQDIPILLLQAEKDMVVDNIGQDEFLKLYPNAKKKIIPHARHELFLEVEYLRSQAMKEIFQFMEK